MVIWERCMVLSTTTTISDAGADSIEGTDTALAYADQGISPVRRTL
jgi:hypothetical protein